MLVAFVYVSYFLLNMHNTPSLTSLSLLDGASGSSPLPLDTADYVTRRPTRLRHSTSSPSRKFERRSSSSYATLGARGPCGRRCNTAAV